MTTLTHHDEPAPARHVFVRRRRVCLWAPVYAIGVALVLVSFTLTLTLNGATVLGTLIALAALGAALVDEWTAGGRP